jgi:IclR family pca regulon transcriptional regulator
LANDVLLTTDDEAPKPGDSYVQSFARGLSVIRVFGERHPQMTLSEVAAATGLTRAGARRILLTLEHLGYVVTDGRRFRLTPKILDLGYAYLSASPLWALAQPEMEILAERTGESCSISVLEGTDIVYILRVATHKIMRVNLSVGSRLPAWATSMGRVLLGGLSQAQSDAILEASDIKPLAAKTITDLDMLREVIAQDRTRGYSYTSQELEDSLRSIAAPIIDRTGTVIAAINISGMVNRNSESQMLETFLPLLLNTARTINGMLQHR